MMDAATVTDFHLQDLTRPHPKRFKRHMSALVNFFRFRSDRLAEFDELVLDTEDLENKRLDLEEGSEQVRQEIDSIVAQRRTEEPQVKQLRETNLHFSDQLLGLKKEQSRLLAEVDTLKVEKANVVQQQTDVQYELQIVGAELSKLQARMVSHPEELRKQIGEMHTQVHSERASLSESEKKAHALTSKMEVLARLDDDLAAALAALEQVAAEMERANREAHALDASRSAIASHEHEQDTLQQRIEQLERHVQHATERLERCRAELEEKRAASQKTLDALTARLGEVSRTRKERHALAEVRNNESLALEQEMETVLQSHEAHYAKMQLEKDALCRTAANYMDAISRTLQNP